MARASVRAYDLLNQRSKFSGYSRFAGGTRAPASGSLGAATASIAKASAATELQDKVKQYNDGIVTNEDMRAFLTRMSTNPLLTPNERVNVQDQIRSFDENIREGQLNATYKNAPDNSVQQIQAAQALANYFSTKAARLSPGTPAQSDALQSAGKWSDATKTIQENMNKTSRALKRATLYNQLADQPPNSVEEAQMKAKGLMELANQAAADGDQQAALTFQTQAKNAQNEIPVIQAKQEKLTTAAERKDIINTINTFANAYHDGKISIQEFASAIPDLESRAVSIGDSSIQLSLNRWADSLAKDEAKGVKRGTLNGLPVVTGRGGKGGGAETTWDVQDKNYQEAMKLMNKWVVKGKDDAGKPYTYQNFINDSALQLQNREQTLTERLDALNAMSPNDRVYVNGKKTRAADLIDELNKELDTSSGFKIGDNTQDGGIEQKIASLVNGDVVLVMSNPSQPGDTGGKSVAKVDFKDINAFDKSNYIQDERGIYHQIQGEKRYLKAADAVGGLYIDQKTNKTYSVKTDSSGRPYIIDKQYVDVFEPGTSYKVRRYINEGDTKVQGISDTERAAYQTQLDTKLRQATGAAELTPPSSKSANLKSDLLTPTPGMVEKTGSAKPGIDIPKIAGDVIGTAKNLVAPQGVNPLDVVKPVVEAVKKVVAPVPQYKSAQELNLPSNIKLNAAPVNLPSQSQTTMPRIQEPKLSIVGAQPQNPLQKAAAAGQIKPISIPGPNIPTPGKPQPSLNPVQFAQQKINDLKNLAIKLWPKF